jgi:hypothetical protein
MRTYGAFPLPFGRGRLYAEGNGTGHRRYPPLYRLSTAYRLESVERVDASEFAPPKNQPK